MAATLLAPALRISLRRRARRGKEIAERLAEREGIEAVDRPIGPLIWIHAASVGETISILPVLEALRGRAKVLLTTGTVTSQTLLGQRLVEMGLAGDVINRFAPLDVPAWVGRFLSHWRPDAACFVESELWPNQIAACRMRGIPMMLVNARISARSFGYWQRVPAFARDVLDGFARIQARGDKDAERLRRLGAVSVDSPGDLKFAAPMLPVDWSEYERLEKLLRNRPVWLAASTHPGEEVLIAGVHRALADAHPGLLTIIAPRHPDRGAALAEALGAPRRVDGPPDRGIWIVDTMGEMGLWYRLAPIVFVGRSLIAPGGGQNPLEPSRLGCAVAVGKWVENFADHVALLQAAGGLAQVNDAAALAGFVGRMLQDPAMRRRLGANAAAATQRHADLPARTADTLLSLMRPG